ncbi:MAG: hypothetical protein KZQ83_12330 [gamma proteobacterium symbiont of Taylorina sp.]|nr:hypothetical protein [gamma proteobacterium symbiont of Taylorina sp.]
MTHTFSPHPGIRERHLQRQYKNPLFPLQQQNFSAQRLSGAHFMDNREQQDFVISFQNLVEDVANLKANEGSEKMLQLKSQLDQCYEQCCSLAGEHAAEKQAITQLVGMIINAIWQSASGDAEAEANLKEEELARTTHYQLLQFPLVVDLLIPESPITEKDLVPSLLSESEEALKAAFYLFDEQQQGSLCLQAVELLEQKLHEKQDLTEAWKRLELMQSLLQER